MTAETSRTDSRRRFLRWTIISAIWAAIIPFSDGLTKVAALAKNGKKADTILESPISQDVNPDEFRPDCCVPIACPSGVCYNGSYPYTGCSYGGSGCYGSTAAGPGSSSSGGGDYGAYGGYYCYGSGEYYCYASPPPSYCAESVSPKQRTGWKRSWSGDGQPQD